MSAYIKTLLVEKFKSRLFSLQMHRTTLRDSEAILLAYARYIDKYVFAEEIVFWKSLEITTSAADIYDKLKNYVWPYIYHNTVLFIFVHNYMWLVWLNVLYYNLAKKQNILLYLYLYETTLRDSEALLLAHARYIYKGIFAKKMVFCKSLETLSCQAK